MQNKIIILLLVLVSTFILSFQVCFAADCSGTSRDGKCNPDCQVCLPNPLGTGVDKTSIPVLLGKIIQSVLGVVGSLALVMFIYGGIVWMLSAGNQERVTKGKQILIWATVGIVVIFTAYALVKFVLTTIVPT